MNEQITVVAEFRVKSEVVEAFKSAAEKVVRATRKETGCLNYDLHQSLEDESIFLMHENWTSDAALEKHFETAHIAEFRRATAAMFDAPVSIRRFKLLDAAQVNL